MQTVSCGELANTTGVTEGVTDIVIALEVAVAGAAQASEEARTAVTTAPLVSAEVIKVLLFGPALVPFIFHWKAGLVPPFTGLAINVSLVLLQSEVADAVMVTAGVCEVTDIVIALEVTDAGDAQGAFEVTTQVTIWPLVNAVVVKVELFVPALAPFTFH